jgi:hypothetical protein
MRRAAAAAALAAALLATVSKAAPMTDDFSFPPWTAGSDETAAVAGQPFADCESVLADWARHGQIEARAYTTSPAWGDILRAKAAMTEGGDTSVHLFTCWTGDGHGVRFAFRPEQMFGVADPDHGAR